MATYYSCNGFSCGGWVLTDQPTIDKKCPKCLEQEKETPVKKKQKISQRLHFIRVCKTRVCSTKIYRKNPSNLVEYCVQCIRDHRRKSNMNWKKRKRESDKQKMAGVTVV